MKVGDLRKVIATLPDDLDVVVGIENDLYEIASADEGELEDEDGGNVTPLLIFVVHDEEEDDEDDEDDDDDDQDSDNDNK